MKEKDVLDMLHRVGSWTPEVVEASIASILEVEDPRNLGSYQQAWALTADNTPNDPRILEYVKDKVTTVKFLYHNDRFDLDVLELEDGTKIAVSYHPATSLKQTSKIFSFRVKKAKARYEETIGSFMAIYH
jgi:hypothetical protein